MSWATLGVVAVAAVVAVAVPMRPHRLAVLRVVAVWLLGMLAVAAATGTGFRTVTGPLFTCAGGCDLAVTAARLLVGSLASAALLANLAAGMRAVRALHHRRRTNRPSAPDTEAP